MMGNNHAVEKPEIRSFARVFGCELLLQGINCLTMSVVLDIPDEVLKALRLPPAEVQARLRLELAVSLYAQQILSLGKAAELAGIPRPELNDLLAARGISMHYSQAELAEDLAYGRGGQ